MTPRKPDSPRRHGSGRRRSTRRRLPRDGFRGGATASGTCEEAEYTRQCSYAK
ncbi:hypothetical protein [Streptomyces luteireticuli]|uniref:hypothetical protein n=1 Tax=Streptomyces luteireticuli TaxID=173858 RepID=UPI0035590D41